MVYTMKRIPAAVSVHSDDSWNTGKMNVKIVFSQNGLLDEDDDPVQPEVFCVNGKLPKQRLPKETRFGSIGSTL